MSYLRMRGITKFYTQSGVLANDNVDFDVGKQEIHAIVGENGAGKTTLMKILHGEEHADEGKIVLDGREVKIENPLIANRLGIGMVHQHFRLVSGFTVAENVVLGAEPRKSLFFIDRERAKKRVGELIDAFGFSLDPARKVSSLTVSQMQQVEIVKALYRETGILILDEPTSVLTEQEIHSLFETLRSLVKRGKTCILITHKLREVKEISDRVTVMRNGKVEAVRVTADVGRRDLARLMIGRDVLFRVERRKMTCGDPVLELEDASIHPRGHGKPLLDRVNLKVPSCHITGIAGVSGNGLGELEDVIAGLRPLTEGRIYHNGEDITGLNALQFREKGLAYVPADRLYRGSSLYSTVDENLIVVNHREFLRGGIIRTRNVRDFTEKMIEKFSIDGGAGTTVGNLSGGNIQKVILARELASPSDFILFSEPTWGLDVESSQFVYEKMLEMRENGTAVLLISSNLEELLALSDVLMVMYQGRIVCKLENDGTITKDLMGEYMLGLRDDQTAGG